MVTQPGGEGLQTINLGQLHWHEADRFFERLDQIFGGVQVVLERDGGGGRGKEVRHSLGPIDHHRAAISSLAPHLMTPEHASHIQLRDCLARALDVVRVTSAAAHHTAVYGNAAEVSPLQIATKTALAAHATPGLFVRGR